MEDTYTSTANVKKNYKDQLIYYYNHIGDKSEITGAIITKNLISVIEKRYRQLGGHLPITEKAILAKKDMKWNSILDN